MNNFSLKELRENLDNKIISVREVTDYYLKRIEDTNEDLNSFITVSSEHIYHVADHAQREIDNGNQSALTGIPYAAKDLFCTRGVRTTAGSKMLNEYVPPYNATVIKKMGDAVLLGKTNMDEFAMGSSNEYSAFGPVKNPYDLSRVAGGSSGGSAAAVASGQAPFALGTDTGGSVRLPAGFTNTVGFKPTYGRISRYGTVAMASSLDTVGMFSRTVEDAAYALASLAGVDALDATTPDVSVDNYLTELTGDISGMKIGLPKEYFALEGLDPGVKKIFDTAVDRLSAAGVHFVEVSLPHTKYAMPAYYILSPSEVSSNMARYDGIQFGRRSKNAKTLDEVFTLTREEGFGVEVKRRILIGSFCLSSGSYDAYYKKAQQVRTLIKEDFDEVFRSVDLLMTPIAASVPFRIGDRDQDPLAMYLTDAFTCPMNFSGVPAISVPGGFLEGLPVGVQFIGNQFDEKTVLKVADAFQKISDFEIPPLKI